MTDPVAEPFANPIINPVENNIPPPNLPPPQQQNQQPRRRGLRRRTGPLRQDTHQFIPAENPPNPLLIPPNEDICREYRHTTSVGFTSNQPNREIRLSKVSNYPLENNTDISFFTNVDKLSTMGFGYPLALKFGLCLLLGVFFLALFGGYFSYLNYKGTSCMENDQLKKTEDYVKTVNYHDIPYEINEGKLTHKYTDVMTNNVMNSRINMYKFIEYSCNDKLNTGDDSQELCLESIKYGCTDKRYLYPERDPKCLIAARNYYGKIFEKKACKRQIFNLFGKGNNPVDYTDTNKNGYGFWMVFAFFCLVLVIITLVNFFDRMNAENYDANNLTLEDFSCKIAGLPQKEVELTSYEENIKSGLKSSIVYQEGQEHLQEPIVDVVLLYDMKEYKKNSKEAKNSILNYAKDNWKFSRSDEHQALLSQGDRANFHTAQLRQQHVRKMGNLSGVGFVTFARVQDADYFRNYYNESNPVFDRYYKYRHKDFQRSSHLSDYGNFWMESAPEPQDIIWKNLRVTNIGNKICTYVIVYLVVIVLAIIFAFVFSLTHKLFTSLVYKYLDRTSKQIWKTLIILAFITLEGLLLLIFQLLGREIIELLIHKIIKFQTYSDEETTKAMIVWKMQFLSIVIPIFYVTIYIENYNYFGRLGLIEFIQIYYFIEIFYIAIMILFLLVKGVLDLVIEHLCCCCPLTKKNRLRNFLKDPESFRTNSNSSIFTQYEANEIYKKKAWEISRLYSSMIKTFMVSLFFFFVFPPSMILGLILMIIYYVFYRFQLIKSSNKLKRFSRGISVAMGIQLGWAILITALALILHQKSIRLANLQEGLRLSFWMVIVIILGIVLGFVGINMLIGLCVGEKGEYNQSNYYQTFGQDNDDGYRAFRDKGDDGIGALLAAVEGG